MSLTLTVLTFKNQPVTGIKPVTIGSSGGGIGRSDDNVLVLPDTEKFVSRHHASISFENGCYYLSDTSLGGVFINNQETPLHNATERIANGMKLRVGEYEIAVAIADEQVTDDFQFAYEPTSNAFFQVDEPWRASEEDSLNSLMTDNFPSHDELVQSKAVARPVAFESALKVNQSPLFDSYIAPNITQSPPPSTSAANEQIPENFSFEDLFSESDLEVKPQSTSLNKASVDNEFEDFFGAALSDMELGSETGQPVKMEAVSVEKEHEPVAEPENPFFKTESNDFDNFFGATLNETDLATETGHPDKMEVLSAEKMHEPVADENLFFKAGPAAITSIELPVVDIPQMETYKTDASLMEPIVDWPEKSQEAISSPIKHEQPTQQPSRVDKIAPAKAIEDVHPKSTVLSDSALFNAFLQGAVVECNEILPEQHTETLYRIGQMFRKLIDGTVAVLRSRAEFKSLCRVNMTVIRAANNNPLKFTVSTDDVLRQLIENKTDGFLASTNAIEESFNDIMNHQLAMQAGIQASLTDLLKTFDPKIIEKQFEQGLVLQKKSKCWDKFEETYRNTVEDAVENFFGEEFVKAYEKQMSLLTSARKNIKN
jgi:type VI secretion system FHA domain protein